MAATMVAVVMVVAVASTEAAAIGLIALTDYSLPIMDLASLSNIPTRATEIVLSQSINGATCTQHYTAVKFRAAMNIPARAIHISYHIIILLCLARLDTNVS